MMPRGFLVCVAAAVCLAPSFAAGQTPGGSKPLAPSQLPRSSVLTILTIPENAEVTLHGASDLTGRSPLDVLPVMTGIYSIVIQGPGFSRTHGLIFLPAEGELPFVVSEPPGVSPALILRGFNFPGVPDMTGGRVGRGITLATAAVAAGVMAVRAQLTYRDRLDEVGDFAGDRAEDERYARNAWITYGGVVWGMSAIDYWIRPRISLLETTPNRLTLGAPKATRGGAVWRSLLIPGAGQEFANHRTRSIVWLASVIGSGAGYVVADYRVRRDETDFKWAQINVDSAGPSNQTQRQLQLEQASRSLSASKNIRQGFLIGTVSFYALNVLDAMVMYLHLTAPDKPKVSSIAPIMLPDGPGLAVNVRFH